MNRIASIFSFINENDKVVDVGCDQAKLGIVLAKKGIKSIASDLRENVINTAKKSIKELKLDNYIDIRVSNGLDNIKEGEADTLVLSGMGTHTIIDIIKKTKLKFKKIITISNNDHSLLRKTMNELDYKVDSELIIKERNKYYNLIIFTPGNKKYTEKELLLGINHLNQNMFNEYKKYLYDKYTNINNNSSRVNDKIKKYLKVLSIQI